MRLIIRLKMAWKSFWLKPFEIPIEPYHKVSFVAGGVKCDCHSCGAVDGKIISKFHKSFCDKNAIVCITRTLAIMRFEENEHRHLSDECADKHLGKFE